MPEPTALPSSSRVVRLIHTALTLGPVLTTVMFVIVRRLSPLPALPQAAAISLPLTVGAIVLLVVALTVLRPRIPEQVSDQTPDAFWGDARVRMTALTTWAVVEGAAILAAIGYLLTGTMLPTLALALGLTTLWWLRPARLES